ncbi:adenylate/guanylate cyclase catalytic domain protein, partial [Leptospira interrogans serovar Icterohaemorrhagiae str. Verdun HP]
MESSGEPGKINVSEESYKLLSPFFTFTSRGKIAAKNKG